MNVEATVVGFTRPGVGDPLSPTRRTMGAGQFDDTQISAVVACTAGGQTGTAVALLSQPGGSAVHFMSDDDITDGHGTISGTDDNSAFRDPTATSTGGPDVVEVRIVSGDFDRFGVFVRVDLLLDVRVERPTFVCHANVEVRIELIILPFMDPIGASGSVDMDPLSGFMLVGVARDHNVDGDYPADRFPCDTIGHQTLPTNDVEHNRYCGSHTG